jgi:hypothetical protein
MTNSFSFSLSKHHYVLKEKKGQENDHIYGNDSLLSSGDAGP